MSGLPAGTVTFLFTDIEGSTPLWERSPEAMRASLARHDEILNRVIAAHDGHVYKVIGDAIQSAFASPLEAVEAAIAAQQELIKAPWGATGPLRVRMGLHTGEAIPLETDYSTTQTLNRAARILSAAHGGQILISQTVAELVRGALPADVVLRDMGHHRMKGLSQSERLYQVIAPDLPSHFPPLLTQVEALHNLPEQLTPFVGRDRELAELADLLANPEVRLVTILGMGGIGKTTLALRFGREIVSSFPHGVWFVPLAPLSSAEMIVTAITGVFNLSSDGEADPKAPLLGYLETKKALLILDNLEHLLPEADPLLVEILQAAGEVKLLVTSRERLNLPAEWVIPLPGLECPPDDQAKDLEAYSAVKLFDESYHRATGRPVLKGDLVWAARICQLVEGLPLAIELAAGWGRVLGNQEIVQEIRSSLSFLETTQAVLPDGQHSLQAVFDYSWKSLTQAEKEAFQKLSVFHGGFDRQAAASVASAPLTELAALYDKSILQRTSQSRFGVHELLRQFGYERLEEAGEAQAIRDSHLDYYLSLAEQAEPELWGARQKHWMDVLELELDNLRAALEWSLAGSDQANVEKGLRLGGALWQFWAFRRDLYDWRKWLESVLQTASAKGPTPATAKALNRSGFLASMQWDWHLSHDLHERGLGMAQSLGDRRETAYALTGLNRDEESMGLFREIGDQVGLALTLNHSGSTKMNERDFSQARPLLEESLAIYRKMGNSLGMGTVLRELGRLKWLQRRPGEAQPLLEESLTLHQELGSQRGNAMALFHLGAVQRSLGNLPKSDELFQQALSVNQEIGYQPGKGMNLTQLGFNRLVMGNLSEALRFMQQSLALYQEIRHEEGAAFARAALRVVYLFQKNADLAQSLHDQNLSYYREPRLSFFVYVHFLVLTDLGQVAAKQGDRDGAKVFLEEGLQVAQASGDAEMIAQAHAFLEDFAGKGG